MENESFDEESAKRIYLQHMGSKYYMERAEVYETYKQWHIHPKKEVAWAKERIREILNNPIDPEMISWGTFNQVIDLIFNSKDSEGLGALLCKIEELGEIDTCSILRICGGLIKLLKTLKDLCAQEFEAELRLAEILVAKLLAQASNSKFIVPDIYMERAVSEDQYSDERIADALKMYKAALQEVTVVDALDGGPPSE